MNAASGGDGRAAGDAAAGADDVVAQRFYQGVIVRVHPGSETGLLRTGNGREVPFAVPDVRILGTTRGFAALREGMHVGFDLGWTSRGMRVTSIRVYASTD